MLRIVNLEEFHRLLLRVPALVDELEERTADAPGAVRSWLIEVEGALENNRMPLAGNIAGLRARLDSASRGAVPGGVVLTGSVTKRKVRYAVAAEVLKDAADTIAAELEADGARIDEADLLARQLVVAAQVKGLVNGPPSRADHADTIQALWTAVLSEPEIGPGAVHLLSLVGPSDAVIVLDRAITRDVWSGRT
jgi:hypothetical protein